MQFRPIMLPRLHHHYEENEPETLRRDSDVVPRTVRDASWDHPEWDDEDEDPTVDTNVMLARHGSKSSVLGVVKPRLVPPPVPFPAGEVRKHMPSLTVVDQPLPEPEPAIAFRDRFASEIDDPSSEEAPVVHRHPVSAFAQTYPANAFAMNGYSAPDQPQPNQQPNQQQVWQTPEQIHEAFLLATQGAPALTAQTSGVQEIAYVTPAQRPGKVRVVVMWGFALVLGAATMAFWRGDISEHAVRVTAARAQVGAVHLYQAIRG